MTLKAEPMLMIPGPTPVPAEVLEALAKHPIGHRSADFKAVISYIQPSLSNLFGTSRQVFTYAASGTGAMEAALVNVLNQGDEILVVSCGVFSERFGDIGKAIGLTVHTLSVPYGQANDPAEVAHWLKENGANIKAVCLIHNETSTTVLNPLPELVMAVKQNSDALVIVDTITGLGATPLLMDEWGVDIAVSGSQKGFMLPPGLAFIAVSEKAYQAHLQTKAPGYYFNFAKYHNTIGDLQTPYTPAVTLWVGLGKALELIDAEGLENTFKRHQLNKNMVRAAGRALNLPFLVEDEAIASPAATGFYAPQGIDVEAIRKGLRNQFGITVASGQKSLKDKIFRIGHLGAIFPRDILTTVASLEAVLLQLNVPVQGGAGVAAAQQIYNQQLAKTAVAV